MACGLMLLAGCGGESAPVAALNLAVTLGGQPAERVTIQLVGPDGKTAGSATAGEGGRATVYLPAGQSLAPGVYKVVATDAGPAEDNPMETAKPVAKRRVPAAYSAAATTKLSLTVEAGKLDYALDIPAQ